MSRTSLPSVCWLGAPPGEATAAAIRRYARLHLGWVEGSAAVCAWAASGPDCLGELPAAKVRPRVFAVFGGPPPVRDRLVWIRAGADEVVSLDGLSALLLRHLHPGGPPPEPVEAPPPPPPPAPPPPPPAPPPPPPPVAPAAPPRRAPVGFPPVSPTAPIPTERAATLLDPLVEYISRRNALAQRLDREEPHALIALSHRRELLHTSWSAPAPVDAYGSRRGGAPSLDWPVSVRVVEDPRASAPVTLGRLVALARDGLTVQLEQPKAPMQRLVLDLNLGDDGHVQLLVECRWQRRVSARRWQLGALILRARRR